MPTSNPNLDYVPLAQINPLTGEIITIDSVTPLSAYSLGTSVFDSYNQTYSLIGVDPSQTFRFYNWMVENDSMFSMPSVNALINDLQHDMRYLSFYGLGSYPIDPINGIYGMRFLEIDQQTGDVTELNKMPEARAFPVGSTAYDANGGYYIANILDDQFNSLIYTIKGNTGEVVSIIPISLPPGMDILNLEYNNQDDLVYGLIRNLNANWFGVGSLNPESGLLVDTVFTIPDLQYFVQGGSVFHQMSQNYVLYYIDTENNSRLLSVNVSSRSLTANPIIPDYFSELQVDNNEYAMTAYHNTVDLIETNKEDKILVYPNPAKEILKIKLSDQISDELTGIELYNSNYNLIESHNGLSISGSEHTMNISNLTSGIYTVRIILKNQAITKLVVVL